jgi:hypothetical protein
MRALTIGYMSPSTSAAPNGAAPARKRLNVHTMLGHKHIALAARCLGSLARFSAEPVHVILHEDGSVTDEDKEAFLAQVPDSTFILKKDADGPMNEFMARYPACRHLRDTLVFGLKIFDIQVLETDEHLAYTDCDILFLKPFNNLFAMPPDPKAGGVFMYDPREAYCLTPLQYLLTRGLRLVHRLNGGLLYFRRAAFDWDLVEWFLRHDEFRIHPYWKEQTAWSVLGAHTGCWMWSEEQVRVINTERDLAGERLAIAHFISSYRSLMDKVPEGVDSGAAPVRIECAPGEPCTFAKYMMDAAKRKTRGALRRLRGLSGAARVSG